MKRFWTGLLAGIGFLILILDARTALMGAAEGIRLCIDTVIPALFPFFILSSLLSSALTGTKVPLLRSVGRLCGMPDGSESLLLTGFLGGYPVGAKAVADTYRAKQLSKEDAQRLLGFCSNAGPSFLFGMVAAFFPDLRYALCLWFIHILSAILTAVLLPGRSARRSRIEKAQPIAMQTALKNSVVTMAYVCGWIVWMRVVIVFLKRWVLWLIGTEFGVLITGFLELSNGCCSLAAIENLGTRFVMASVMLGFGGVCVWLQTLGVAGELGSGWYLRGKLIQTALSLLVSVSVQHFWLPIGVRMEVSWVIYMGILGLLGVFWLFLQKNSRNSKAVVV